MYVTIQKATPADVEVLQQLSLKTYYETFFEAFNDPADFEGYTTEVFALSRLKAEMEDCNSLFYMAMLENTPVAYIKLNTGAAQTIFHAGSAMEIERIYVLSDYQNKRIGKALINYTIAISLGKRIHWVWLAVWSGNYKAIGFYRQFGFTQFATHHYKIADDEQTDFLLRLSLLDDKAAITHRAKFI